MPHRHAWKLALLIVLASLPLKLLLAQNIPWEIDYVPLIWRNWQFLQGGAFPAVGTLSSVAAYNMPFLVWLHLPALALTHHAAWAMLLTMLAWHALTCAYLYALGRALFRPIVGVLAVLLFAFSPSGIGGAYTSWAQLLLPGFYIMPLYHLWAWHRTGKARHMVLCGVIALCGFMTHFSAVMLFPAILVGAIVLRVRWSLRGLAVGIVMGVLLLAPYMIFEGGRDFADLRAFASRTSQVDHQIMAQYERYKAENISVAEPLSVNSAAQIAPNQAAIVDTAPESFTEPSLIDRLAARLGDMADQLRTVLAFPTFQEFYTLREVAPVFYLLPSLMTLSLWGGVLWAMYRTGRLIWRSGRRNAWAFWRESDAGRALFVAGYGLMPMLLMIGLRAGQYTYYIGLVGLIYLLIAYAWMEMWRLTSLQSTIPLKRESPFRVEMRHISQGLGWCLVVVMIGVWLGGNVADRILEYQQHDDQVFTPFNASLYRHAEAATDLIANDWNRAEPVRVSYDLLPELPNLWWLPAWGSIDPLYRMGTPYDVLLEMNHGLSNTNTSPLGLAEDADYVVSYTPALKRYPATAYQEIGRAGTTVVLKPITP